MKSRRTLTDAELSESMKTIQAQATRFLAGKAKTRATWAMFTAELEARAEFVNLVRSTPPPPPPSCTDFVASPDFAAAAARDRTARAAQAHLRQQTKNLENPSKP